MSVGLRLDTDDPTPPYEQVRRQLVVLIETGTLARGTRLPPVRQLAADLALATGTVARAYRELEADGLVRTRRGGGTSVNTAQRKLSDEDRERRQQLLAEQFVQQSRLLGSEDATIRAAMDVALTR